jgi:arabinose-5-phosphate isomerase
VFNWSELDDAVVADHTISLAKAVIATEINGLNLLSESIGESFCKAVDLLMAATGRVIFLGMGKSGHVARKIAATMASTGTPAFFVHLGEAAHGDMGMIQSNDVVVLISNSGETSEAIQVIRYCKRADVKIIVISAGIKSLMMRAADVGLLLPSADEACLIGLAPTTSSMMMMSLGDALSVVLMRKRGFTLPNFLELHPGGKIGLMRTPVTDIMAKSEALPLVQLEDKMDDVIIEITAKSYGIAGVLDDAGNLVGTISDGDLRRNLDGLMNARAGNVMHAGPITVETDAKLKDVKALLSKKKISCVFVCDQQKPVGLIHMHHLLALKTVI